MKNITVMLKPASSLCNMRCKYCFYTDISSQRQYSSYGIMPTDTLDRILENIFSGMQSGDLLNLVFQGGEPTLAGLSFFQHLVDWVASHNQRGIQVSYALQTNGLVLDDQWCRFLKKHRFLVGLSLDGPAQYHNANRIDAAGNETFQAVLAAKNRMDQYGVPYNVLMVLTNSLARHPQQIWRFLLEQNIRYVQFVPCLGPLSKEESRCALTPSRYASFYRCVFDEWLKYYRQGRYISIKLIDDLVNLLAFGQCNACGLLGFCQPQLVVESDGSVYPCDFYVLDAFCTGNLAQMPLVQVMASPVAESYLHRPRGEMPLCAGCPYVRICGGGCRRMQQEVFHTASGKVCGHRLFLDHAIVPLRQLAHDSRNFFSQQKMISNL